MFHLTPFRYLVGAFLSDVLHDVPINCTLREYAVFSPPSGQTCEQYLKSYFADGAPGYLNNPSATSDCQVCPYNVGDEYLATLEIYWTQRWQYVGYFIAYIVCECNFIHHCSIATNASSSLPSQLGTRVHPHRHLPHT